jgi:hypothetical protein
MFGAAMISSTAFCRNWHSPGHHSRYPHNRVVVKGSTASAIIATGIIAGITFSLLDSAVNAPAPRCAPSPQPVYSTANPSSYTASSGSVMVTAQMLNVRSGPGLENPAVRQVPNGTVLSVQGNTPGWYYVKTADNLYGWVMVQYTAPLGYSAAG